MSVRLCLALAGVVWELVDPRANALTGLPPVKGCAAGSRCPPPRGSHGEDQWALYPKGTRPGSLASPAKQLPAERYALADPGNLIGNVCSPTGEVAGNYYYNVAHPTMIPYIVNDASKRQDAVAVIAPGGGHDHLAIDVSGLSVAEWFNSIGISAFVVKYRVPARQWKEGTEVSLMDVQRAVSTARQWAIHHGVSSDHVILFGSSAGGGLAAQLIMRNEARSYFPIDEIDSLSFHPNFAMLLYPSLLQWDFEFGAAPPKTFMATAADDPCTSVDAAIRCFHALKRSGEHAEFHVYPSGKHGYGTCSMYPEWKKNSPVCGWVAKAETWLAGALNRSAAAPAVPGARPEWCPPDISVPLTCAGNPRACIGHCEGACSEQC